MQTDNKDFDRKIRSMIENAEEQVPPRVWESVSASLVSNTKTKTLLIFKRLTPLAAVAASALAILFFKGTDSSNGQIELTAKSGQLPTEEIIDIVKKEDISIIADNFPKSKTAAATQQKEELLVEEEAMYCYFGELNREERASEKDNVAATEPTNMENITDPFAELEQMDKRKESVRKKTSIAIAGNMLSNGNPNDLRHKRFGRFDPTLVRQTGVTQTSAESSYSIPVTLGVEVKIPISERWSVESGINFSMLGRRFNGIYTEVTNGTATKVVNGEIYNSLLYLGIPINACYDVISSKNLQIYSYGGFSLEKGILNKYSVSGESAHINFKEKIPGMQVSATLGFGVGFGITDFLEFYIDPSIKYFFNCNQPVSIRTQQPLMMEMQLGFRFKI